jgi:predicted nucleic acid-binding protein
VLVVALADDGTPGDAARARFAEDPSLHAPHLVDLEVISALRRRAAAGDLDQSRAHRALRDLESLSITRYPHLPLVRRAWELRHNMTPYDAAYVSLAEALACVLVTWDRRLASSAGSQCEIELLGRA